ncbi:MAG TPA: hypothetical protein VIL86_01600 [Tepidisphaeraceae bacterium]
MAVPHYEAVKIGDRYELVPKSDHVTTERCACTAGGALLTFVGLSRRTIPGLFLAAFGVSLLYRRLTRGSLLRQMLHHRGHEPAGNPNDSPSYQHEDFNPSAQLPQDEVEEASMESFPASDPPAHSTANTG